MNEKLLTGKVAVVTGGSSGIGRATGLELARLGASVVLQARRGEKLEEVLCVIRGMAGHGLSVVGDASKAGDVRELMERAREFSLEQGREGKIDIVMVNAGRGLAGGLLASDTKQWEEMFALNVLGAAHLMRLAGEVMVKQGSGDIVVLGSVSGHHVSPFSGFYGSTKFAIAGMAEAFRREVCGKGVRVTTLKPAIVLSEFQEVAGYTQENFYRNAERYGKLLSPEDVARVVGFVVSQPGHVHVNEVIMRPTGQDYP